MDHFFKHCGEFINHECISTGDAPQRQHSVVFYYTRGESTYNGAVWNYKLYA